MTNAIIERLKGYFDKSFRDKLKTEETLKGLIKRMEEKEKKLVEKLKQERSESKAKLIRKQIKVLAAQCKKARKKLG